MAKTFSKDDVASHGKGDSMWIVIDEDVYDVSKFQDEHPGKCFAIVGEYADDHMLTDMANRWKEKYVMVRPRDLARY